MPFIKPLCPSVALERPEVKGLRAFGFRSFYKCGTKSLIGPIGIDIQLFNPIPVQNQHTGNCIVDFSHPYLGKWHDGCHKVPFHLLIEMHKRGNRRHRRMARAQENFCGSPIVRLFGPPNPGHTFNSHSRRSTTCAEHAQPVVSEGGLERPQSTPSQAHVSRFFLSSTRSTRSPARTSRPRGSFEKAREDRNSACAVGLSIVGVVGSPSFRGQDGFDPPRDARRRDASSGRSDRSSGVGVEPRRGPGRPTRCHPRR